MTATDDRSAQHRRDLIAFATRSQLGRSGKAAFVCLLIVLGLPLLLKTLDQGHGKRRSSAGAPLAARTDTVDAERPSRSSAGFDQNLIWLPIGYESFRAR